MDDRMLTAQEVIDKLGLEPLQGEGGYYKVAHACFDSRGVQLAGSIWYLVTPDSFSSLHWLPTDEIWYHCLGDPLEQLLLAPDGTWSIRRLGDDLAQGESPMSVVPGGYWQGTRLAQFDIDHVCSCEGRFGYALCSTVMSPPYDATTYRQGTKELSLQYPDCPLQGFLG